MKKKIITTVSILVSIVVLGLGIYHSDAAKEEVHLTTDEVKNLVSTQYPGDITEIELVERDSESLYQLTIEDDDKHYHLKLDASSGEILELKENVHVATNEQEKNGKEKQTSKKEKGKSAKKNESTGKNNKQKDDSKESDEKTDLKQENDDKKALISIGEASDIALKEFFGQVTEVELEEEDGRLIYEVEIETGEQEAEIEIDAYTGEVLVLEIDD